jgi:hypothetical protein
MSWVAASASDVADPATGHASYLFLWAGDAGHEASDFLAVIDADPASPRYGAILASLPTGQSGTHPHHTEHEMSANGHLLANGFHAGRTWLFDLTRPLEPRILSAFDGLAGFNHPHTFIRLEDGNILATFQYRDGNGERATGGLVEMTERGEVLRAGAARDTAIADSRIYPYSVLPMPAIDRAVSTTTDMDMEIVKASSEWVQFWRLSDLTLLHSVGLEPGPRGDENQLSGEPRLLADGRSVYIHTFKCGLYLLQGVADPRPRMSFVHGFEGKDCGVPVLAGHYWLQPVPAREGIVALDISDPEKPREVSSLKVGDGEAPHWIAIDPSGRRVVLNSGGYAPRSNRLFMIHFDPQTGKLSLDEDFRDSDDGRPGINLTGKSWPHGFTGKSAPHGTVFSR